MHAHWKFTNAIEHVAFNTQVQCVKWWMAHYKADTPKRHYAYGNSKAIKRIDKGKLVGWKPKASKVVTAQHYVDKSGKKRYKGTKKLRSTETLNLYIGRLVPL